MKKLGTRTVHIILDLSILFAAYGLAYALRFDWSLPIWEARRLVVTLPYVLALQYGSLVLFGVPRFSWRYVGLREVIRIQQALAAATLTLLTARLGAAMIFRSVTVAEHAIIPIGVILIDAVLAICAVSGIRMTRRVLAERLGKHMHRDPGIERVPTILIGAGQAGVMVAREIEARPDLGIQSVGFLDDDPSKVGNVIYGISVFGTTEQLPEICQRTKAKQALITIARADGRDVRRIVKLCETAGISVKIIPSIHEIVGGRVNLLRMRNVAIQDLLGREPVKLDEDAISDVVHRHVVLITGAGGSIGSELCRQVCRFNPKLLVLVERAENSLFAIHRELTEAFPNVRVVPRVADVCDAKRMEAIFRLDRPAHVFHAAAHKHVPMMECNPGEAIKNNVFGTRTIADLAHEYGATSFVMISTDKAVNPASIMGASKRLAEIYIQALSQRSNTRFLAVRFGNVLGSAGSVVPIFQEQIANGGPIKVTHPDMKRYFMTIPEASQLVLQAATMGRGAEIFILDMGEPVKIVDLAHDLIQLSGLRPGEDIEVIFTGVRPGEKLFEELSVAEENADRTRHQKIFVGRLKPLPWEQVLRCLNSLEPALEDADAERVRHELLAVVPELQRFSSSMRAVPAVSEISPAMQPLLVAER